VFYDDEQAEEGLSLREFSVIIFLRKFNNWIKSVLINKYVEALDFKHLPSVFDLCSGRGGDLNKWLFKKPSHYIALEYQENLIEKAMDRFKNLKKAEFPAIFIVGDAGDKNTTID
jgi:mRNA (guanine-N7-)-methyltransferase